MSDEQAGEAREGGASGHAFMPGPDEAMRLREAFWQNVLRETLVSLPAAAAERPELLDGRFAILTRAGERIPVRAIRPLLAVSMPATPEDQAMSRVLQCTVFQVITPRGEEFTLPLHEIRGLHSISEHLAQSLEQRARRMLGADAQGEPFGFAAYKVMIEEQRAAERGPQGAD